MTAARLGRARPEDPGAGMAASLPITNEQYLYFARRALGGMTGIVAGLGDDLANRKPALDGANSPYALLNHCLGVVSYWAGSLVAGRPVPRDRAGEFTASGPVGPLLTRARVVAAQLAEDVAAADPRMLMHGNPPARCRRTPSERGSRTWIPGFRERMKARYGRSPAEGHTRIFTDLLQLLQVMIEQATVPGDGVAVHIPAYPPFLASIARSGRRTIPPCTPAAAWADGHLGFTQSRSATGGLALLAGLLGRCGFPR